jgi:hypothetical protein
MIENPHIDLQLERIARATKHLPRDALEKFLLNLVGNFLKRELVYTQWIDVLKNQLDS